MLQHAQKIETAVREFAEKFLAVVNLELLVLSVIPTRIVPATTVIEVFAENKFKIFN